MSSPTLLVGLGGTGSKIVAKVSEMIPEEQRRNISCVIFDTDANDIPVIKEEHPEIRVVQTSARMTVGEYLEEDHYARDTWFPVNPPLDRKVLSEGAGQVRSISRLGFESAMRIGGMQPLHDAIQDLFKVDQKRADQALRVTIVSSLAGGTGSGLIVPVAMYIRRYLEDNFHQNANISRGFFILPEVFYGAIPADQRNNLKSNAYASLRELDAFLMKGNKTLSEEYRDSVKLELPVAGTDRHEEYDVSPYDFCFLFDAQNANGEKLNSLEQYMDHAANILYSMSIGPMNKRSNSSEDNVIRKLAKEQGRNRYAGAGASRLIYPYEDICRLIGLSWASSSISEQWLQYDRKYKEDLEKAQKRKEEGYAAEDVDRSREYVSSLTTDAQANMPFAKSIVHSVEPADQVPLYDKYVDEVSKHISEGLASSETVAAARQNALRYAREVTADSEIEDGRSSLKKGVAELKNYLQAGQNYVSGESRNVAYTLFEGSVNQGKNDEPFFLETIIRNSGDYLHPNAVRYLLIHINKRMKEELEKLRSANPKTYDSINSYISSPWKSLSDDGSVSIDDYQPKGFFNKKKTHKAAHADLASELNRNIKKTEGYLNSLLAEKIYEEGVKYTAQLIKGLEAFYDAFETQIGEIEDLQEEIFAKYTQAPGMTVRYVAASRPALNRLMKKYPYTGSTISVDSDLSRRITDKVFEYAKKTNKPNSSRYFGDLFEDQILDHYQEQANKKLARDLDNGVLEAIELEANLMLDEEQKESKLAVDSYIRNVINDTRNLSTPFIEKPSEINAAPIYACAFHPSLMPKRGDESYNAKLIQEELVAKGGTGDDDIDKNTILFYQSYYGLRANSLSKFAPPKDSETHHRNGGEYFNAYMELIRGIHPNSRLSQEITPHIDRRWHLAAKMPDLDEGNQVIEEYGINAAFFWTIVLDLLKFRTESSGKNVLELDKVYLALDDGTLLIDERNRASKLPEVLQALALQPAYVQRIRNYARQVIEQQTEAIKNVEKTEVYTRLRHLQTWFNPEVIGLPGAEGELKQSVNLFTIPLVMKASMPVDAISDQKLVDLLLVMLKESASYISGFCSPEELSGKIRDFVYEQYQNFVKVLLSIEENDNVISRAILKDSLIQDELDTASLFLQEKGVFGLSADIKEASRKMKDRI